VSLNVVHSLDFAGCSPSTFLRFVCGDPPRRSKGAGHLCAAAHGHKAPQHLLREEYRRHDRCLALARLSRNPSARPMSCATATVSLSPVATYGRRSVGGDRQPAGPPVKRHRVDFALSITASAVIRELTACASARSGSVFATSIRLLGRGSCRVAFPMALAATCSAAAVASRMYARSFVWVTSRDGRRLQTTKCTADPRTEAMKQNLRHRRLIARDADRLLTGTRRGAYTGVAS
jgi:hypothetical protein